MSLRPWREIAEPHPDVSSGRYHQAEFAADLAQVLAGKAGPEYQDPVEFFSRTYLTSGMTALLKETVQRLAGKAGEPVVQLKTAFGGGKTHSMLALYHLACGDVEPDKLAGIPAILEAAGVPAMPEIGVAVLVGTALNPAKPRKIKGARGKEIRTLWGEMAYQLGGMVAFESIEMNDKNGTSPGSDDLVELFNGIGSCLILVDELVAYARNLYGKDGLSAGSFESIMTFIQALTEAARRSDRSVVVAAIPESDIELGGQGGRKVLESVEHIFSRLEAIWKPVGAREGFEIVRRRLFRPIKDESGRDKACQAFSKMYRSAPEGDFPSDCKEKDYLDRLKGAYPIHPEFFDRLYEDWSTLERFQRTRGVLRLMAAVIHELWVRNDQSALIMPGSIPMDAQKVRDELTRYLPDGWNGVVDSEIDGASSEPTKMDQELPRFGASMATRRVARSIFLGSAALVPEFGNQGSEGATTRQTRGDMIRGIESIRVRLGVLMPDESVVIFNDCMGKLSERTSYLFRSDQRFWYDVKPNLSRLAKDRMNSVAYAAVMEEIESRLRAIRERGEFVGVHICPEPGDVPDEQTARLVILRPEQEHRSSSKDSAAFTAAQRILESRGNIPRQYRNMLLFVAPDHGTAEGLLDDARWFLAWKSVKDDSRALNLAPAQQDEADRNVADKDSKVDLRLNEVYCWLLVPTQDGTNPIEFEVGRLPGGSQSFVSKAAARLKAGEQLITRWSPALLKMELDRWLWKDQPHISTKKLWECLTSYPYLARLKNEDVLLDAITGGLSSRDFFGYAHSVSQSGRYEGLVFGQGASVTIDSASVLVKPEAAAKQEEEDLKKAVALKSVDDGRVPQEGGTPAPTTKGAPDNPATAPKPTRFYAKTKLDVLRLSRDANEIATSVVQHLQKLHGAQVEVYIDVSVSVSDGIPDDVVRTVTENCNTLKFEGHGFERE